MTPEEFNRAQMEAGRLTGEMLTEMVGFWQEHHGLEVDGRCGPATLGALQAVLVPRGVPRDGWKPWAGPLARQPRNRREVYEVFGNPGHSEPDRAWAGERIVELHASHGNRLPGVPARCYVKVHRQVEPYLREALRRARVACPGYAIERVAGYVFRHIRHDPGRPLSMHAWGIAVDIDPHRNFAKVFPRGQAPRAWSEAWLRIWPDGLPRALVEAFASCGFTWGSDWDEDGDTSDHTFLDPMHFEWVARDGRARLG